MIEMPETFFVFVSEDDEVVAHNVRVGGQVFSAALAVVAHLGEEWRQRYYRNELEWQPFIPDPSSRSASIPNPKYPGFISFFGGNVLATGDQLEYEGEGVRQVVTPCAPSRLSAVYAFGDEQVCHEAAARYGWNVGEVRRAKLIRFLRMAMCDMEIVSFIRRHANTPAMSNEATRRQLWEKYWNGAQGVTLPVHDESPSTPTVLRSGPTIWEYLIDGALRLLP